MVFAVPELIGWISAVTAVRGEFWAITMTHGELAIGIVGGTGQTGTAVANALRGTGSRVLSLSRQPPRQRDRWLATPSRRRLAARAAT